MTSNLARPNPTSSFGKRRNEPKRNESNYVEPTSSNM
jgi:hypothetical protein